ncbi:parallel beta-helix repeat (two copies), partial [Thermoplasmatales archaeon SCGC AB-539-N05]
MKIKPSTLLALFLICSLILMFIPESYKATNDNTILVNNEEASYTSIQNAIDSASNGDIVTVSNGTYYGTVIINKAITLIGANKNTTIINADGKENAIDISASYVTITGFTIVNCGPDKGAAILINSSHNNISSCIITNNSHHGIYLSPSSSNNTIYDNIIADNVGKGITASSSKNNFISKNTITNNECGICPCASENNTITCNIVENNTYGLFMCSTANNNIIYHNDIINNRGQQTFDINNNIWYNATLQEGNYWSDYTGNDNNTDNIGDTPYNVFGGENKDAYPLMKPYNTINHENNTTNDNNTGQNNTSINQT